MSDAEMKLINQILSIERMRAAWLVMMTVPMHGVNAKIVKDVDDVIQMLKDKIIEERKNECQSILAELQNCD